MSDKKVILKTETERILYQKITELKEDNDKLFEALTEKKLENEKLQMSVKVMNQQILELEKQAKCSSTQKPMDTSSGNKGSPGPSIEYHTDEEELAKETEWIRVKSRKKRKLSTSPIPAQSPELKLSNTETRNNAKERFKKVPLPPPIMVSGVDNYQTFFDLLSGSVSEDSSCFTIKMMNGNNVKINVQNEDAYRSLTKVLSQNQFLWHSYENKQDRPIRVMAKKLPASCQPKRIIEDLQSKGYKINNAVNKLRWQNKVPLDMFTLTFSNEEDINKIYAIKYILGCKVEISPLKSTKLVPQCKKCQAYGHTQKYCAREARCVKCTGKHLTRDCTKPADEKPKCLHCGEAHPASYRGCVVAKEMQILKNKNLKKPVTSHPQHSSKPEKPILTTTNMSKKTNNSMSASEHPTYAQKASKNLPSSQLPQVNMNSKLDEILKYMFSFDERLKKLENGVKKATNK